MRKLFWLILVLVLLMGALYFFLFNWVVPKAASLTVPGRWNRLPIKQPKSIVHDYLGQPTVFPLTGDTAWEGWTGGSKGKSYLLKIYYVTDSIAGAYSIHYQYRNPIVSRDYLIDSFNIQ
jgi:hypothetical protein